MNNTELTIGMNQKVHMIGIGGIGMSALAQLYLTEGYTVTGSDREESPTTRLLEEKGVHVSLKQSASNVPKDIDFAVYSDAVWRDNPERAFVRERGVKELSYFEALGEASRDKFTIAVSGVHGKTTTTALLVKMLRDLGKNPNAIIGSLVPEFGSNFVEGGKDLLVVEACEYKDHLLKLSPNILVVTNIEWDHTDWFPSLSAMQDMFSEAVGRVPEDGAVIANPGDENVIPVLRKATATVIDYTRESTPELMLLGGFNQLNAKAAKAAARAFDPTLAEQDIDASAASFKGAWRRFEKKGTLPSGALVYDDYAHHPTAIRETLSAAREKFPERKIILVFHPHLYSRTKDLFEGFVTELSKADRVIMVPIYPAREDPIPGVTSDVLAERIRQSGTSAASLHTFEEIESEIRNSASKDNLIITMGAGDVYKVADALVRGRTA